jgi:ankyrin repeat protein
MYRVEDPTLPWRHPSKFCTRPAGAAFALFNHHFLGAKSDEAISRAVPWLKLSAEHGYPVAMALCAQLNKQWSVGLSEETRLSWLRRAAEGGSNPALAELKNTHPESFRECLHSRRETFWPHYHGVSNSLLTKLRSCPRSICAEDSELSPMPVHQNAGDYDDSLLHLAAMIGSIRLVRFCLEGNCMDINKRNARGETPLLLACKSGHTGLIDVLLDLGADPTVSSIYNENCLHWLISFDDNAVFEYARIFLERGVDLHQSATLDERFSDNIARKFFLRTVAGTPLHRAVDAGNRLVVQALLDLGAESLHLSQNFTPLCRAAANHHVDILRLILSYPLSADIDTPYLNKSGSHRFTHLNRAIRAWEDMPLLFYINDRYDYSTVGETLRILVAAGAKINNAPTDMLGLAVTRRNYLATDFIISNGYDGLECRFPQFQFGGRGAPTALHIAISGQDFNTIDVLVRHGANVNAELNWYEFAQSTLYICSKLCLKAFGIASRLIEAGAAVNHVALEDGHRETPLSRALILNNFGFADFLITNGASASYVPPFWPPINCINSVIVSTDHGKWLYRALEFLINRPNAELPFWSIEVLRVSVFHSIFSRSELRLKFTDPAGVQALFRLLQRQFPDVDIPNVYGATALHYAVYTANVTGVKLLLEAGCDRRYRATPSDEDFLRIARESLERIDKEGSDVTFNDEDCREVAEKCKAELLPPYTGKSVVEMAQADMFSDIPSFVRDNPEELDEYLRRRTQIKEMLAAV